MIILLCSGFKPVLFQIIARYQYLTCRILADESQKLLLFKILDWNCSVSEFRDLKVMDELQQRHIYQNWYM